MFRIVMSDGRRNGRDWVVCTMSGDVARRIRRRQEENSVIRTSGSREMSRGRIGALMEGDVKLANLPENPDRRNYRIHVVC